MTYDRRRALRLLGAGSLATLAPSFVSSPAAAAPRTARAALLVPLTGASAALGVALQRAASVAFPMGSGDDALMTFDTGGAPAGAGAAAGQAVRRGAKLILGPLFSGEVRPVLDAVRGRVPVLSFSNDMSLRESGAFLLGVTASQTVSAVLNYARSRGIRQVAVLRGQGIWSEQAVAVARALQAQAGIDVVVVPSAHADLQGALRQAAGGQLPDALLVPDGSAAFVSAARALRGSGVQLLGTHLAVDYSPAALAAAEGAWLAAPPPNAFAAFAREYGSRHGGVPGAITALGYDAARIANALAQAGRVDRAGLLALQGFSAATGALRFRSDGSCMRDMGILVARADGYDLVQTTPSA